MKNNKSKAAKKNPAAVALGKLGGRKSGGKRPGAGRKPEYVECPKCGKKVTKTQASRGHEGCL
jgi:hypothetical protein